MTRVEFEKTVAEMRHTLRVDPYDNATRWMLRDLLWSPF